MRYHGDTSLTSHPATSCTSAISRRSNKPDELIEQNIPFVRVLVLQRGLQLMTLQDGSAAEARAAAASEDGEHE